MLPAQITLGETAAVTVGEGVTLRLMVVVVLHPGFVPVTVYTVLAAGLTTATEEAPPAGIQLYVAAPLAVKVAEAPEHKELLELATVTLGVALIVKLVVALLEHPVMLLVAVTVYTCEPVAEGVRVAVFVLMAPGFICQAIFEPVFTTCPLKVMFGLLTKLLMVFAACTPQLCTSSS